VPMRALGAAKGYDMNKLMIVLLAALLGTSIMAVAAPENDKQTDKEAVSAASEDDGDEAEDSAQQAPAVKKRDTITLKSGVVLTDIKILSKSPLGYEVSVADDVTITIPRKQVADIEYEQVAAEPESEETVVAFPGDTPSADVQAKLSAPVAEMPVEPEDFLAVFEHISKASGIVISVLDPVKAMPEGERVWTIERKPDLSLMALLKDDFLVKFPKLEIICKQDTLVVGLKTETAENPSKTGAPPEAPAAPKQ